jgi:hypothetical protein
LLVRLPLTYEKVLNYIKWLKKFFII